MAEHLREKSLIAIHYNPQGHGNVWLAYSRYSQEFEFLSEDTRHFPDGVPIFLAVRSALAPIEKLSFSVIGQPMHPQSGLNLNSPLAEHMKQV